VQEVCGSVERIDDPDQTVGHNFRGQLFTNELRARLGLEQQLCDEPLSGTIHFGDEVPAPLEAPSNWIRWSLGTCQIIAGPGGGASRQMQ
jgi:hypothetical protein